MCDFTYTKNTSKQIDSLIFPLLGTLCSSSYLSFQQKNMLKPDTLFIVTIRLWKGILFFFFYFRYHAIDLTPDSSPAPSWCQRPAVLVKKDESFRKEKNSGSHTLSFCSNVVIRWNQTIVLMAQSHSVSCDMNCVQIVVVFFQPRSWICLLVHGRHSTVRGESFACALYGDRIEMSELSWTSKGINGWEQTVRSSIIATGV